MGNTQLRNANNYTSIYKNKQSYSLDYNFKPNQQLGRICYVFYYYLLPFVFYKASNACFLLEIAHYYSQKQQATSALLKIQNSTSPNDRIGLNLFWQLLFWLLFLTRQLPMQISKFVFSL